MVAFKKFMEPPPETAAGRGRLPGAADSWADPADSSLIPGRERERPEKKHAGIGWSMLSSDAGFFVRFWPEEFFRREQNLNRRRTPPRLSRRTRPARMGVPYSAVPCLRAAAASGRHHAGRECCTPWSWGRVTGAVPGACPGEGVPAVSAIAGGPGDSAPLLGEEKIPPVRFAPESVIDR